jgi:hypothetical protein
MIGFVLSWQWSSANRNLTRRDYREPNSRQVQQARPNRTESGVTPQFCFRQTYFLREEVNHECPNDDTDDVQQTIGDVVREILLAGLRKGKRQREAQSEHSYRADQNAQAGSRACDLGDAGRDRGLEFFERYASEAVATKFNSGESNETRNSWKISAHALAFLFHEGGDGAHQIVFGENLEFGAVHFHEDGGIFVAQDVGDALDGRRCRNARQRLAHDFAND